MEIQLIPPPVLAAVFVIASFLFLTLNRIFQRVLPGSLVFTAIFMVLAIDLYLHLSNGSLIYVTKTFIE